MPDCTKASRVFVSRIFIEDELALMSRYGVPFSSPNTKDENTFPMEPSACVSRLNVSVSCESCCASSLRISSISPSAARNSSALAY